MTEDSQPPRRSVGGLLAGSGALTGLASLIGASCCVLPLLLAQVGFGAALVSQLSFLAQAKPYLLGLTLALVIAGLTASFRGGRRPRPLVVMLLVGAALLAAAAWILPSYEGQIMRWIGY